MEQSKIAELLALEKYYQSPNHWNHLLIPPGRKTNISLHSKNGREKFIINYSRYSINLSKRNHHLQARKNIGLLRLDLDGPEHMNPDQTKVGPCHLHYYKPGYGLKWARELQPEDSFLNLGNLAQTLADFLRYCNVQNIPNIQEELSYE